jgi:hypothetical protein
MSIKQQVYHHCLGLLQNKQKVLEDALKQALESGNQDSKSSAGDKHETAKAMLQLEQEKLAKQIQTIEQQTALLYQYAPATKHSSVVSGSLVQTNRGYFYIAVGLGKLSIDNINCFAISAQSPIGQVLLNKQVNDRIVFNQIEYAILEIL